ncbi:MAG: TPM domain-containing protein [Salinibacter sp.]
MRSHVLAVLAIFVLWGLGPGGTWEAQAQNYDVPSRPAGPVLDRADLLSNADQQRLAQKLSAFEDTTSTAIVVVTLPTLDGAPISDYAFELGRAWGVGQEDKDNGVVVLVSEGDREVFIATGYGVEGALPDAIANRIVETVMTPAFRKGQFYAGLDRGTDAIIQATRGEFDASARRSSSDGDDGVPYALLFTLLIFAYFFGQSIFRGGSGQKSRRSRRRGGPVVIWGGGGVGGGGGGMGSGGGGFGGFGGGSFGGGGAGGSW